jgi:hypothetical protein
MGADARRDQQKREAYARFVPNVYPFVPFSIESYVRLGPPAMKPLHKLGYEASGPGGDERASFVAGVLQCIARAGCTQTKMVVVIISYNCYGGLNRIHEQKFAIAKTFH